TTPELPHEIRSGLNSTVYVVPVSLWKDRTKLLAWKCGFEMVTPVGGAVTAVNALIATGESGSLTSVRVLVNRSTENHSTFAEPPRSYQTMRNGYNPACEATKSNVSSAGPPLWKASGGVFRSFSAVP